MNSFRESYKTLFCRAFFADHFYFLMKMINEKSDTYKTEYVKKFWDTVRWQNTEENNIERFLICTKEKLRRIHAIYSFSYIVVEKFPLRKPISIIFLSFVKDEITVSNFARRIFPLGTRLYIYIYFFRTEIFGT